jgi:hypothetical protein
MTYERVTMSFEPDTRVPHVPTTEGRRGESSVSRGDGFAGGCISLIVLLIEIPVAILLGLMLAIRGWGRADERSGASTMDWVPVLWLGGFALGVLVVAVVFLCSAHPCAGAVQLLLAGLALIFALTAWREESERAHPSPLPTCSAWAGRAQLEAVPSVGPGAPMSAFHQVACGSTTNSAAAVATRWPGSST